MPSTAPVPNDCFETDYQNVATTATAPATGTGLTVNFEVVDGVCQSVKINRMGDANWNSGDRFTIDGFAGIVCEYFEGTAGEEVHVHYDDEFVEPYAIKEFSWPFKNARLPRVAVASCDYLEHTDDNDIKTLTINDTTIIVNRGETPAMAAATEPAMEPEGFLVLDQLAFQQVYTFVINQNGTETTIASTATTNDLYSYYTAY